MATIDIGELLIQAGVMDRTELMAFQERSLVEGPQRLARELRNMVLVHERQLAEHLAQSTGHPCLVMSASVLDLYALRWVPVNVARTNRALPVAIDDESITVAVIDPEPGRILDQIAFASGRTVTSVLALWPLFEVSMVSAYEAAAQGDTVLRGQASEGDQPKLDIVHAPSIDTGSHALEAGLSTPAHQLSMPPPTGLDAEAGSGEADGIADDDAILVAEDDPAILDLLCATVERDGYRAVKAASGDEAVAYLRRHRPRMVLLDAMLPGVHGFEICARMKRSDVFRSVPVVMVSAVYRGWENAREAQEVHGADAFVEKPFDVHYLRKLVGEVMGRPLSRVPLDEMPAREVLTLRHAFQKALVARKRDDAEMLLKRWLALDPFDAVAFMERGQLKEIDGDIPGALRDFECAAVYAPSFYQAQLRLALCYERLGFQRRAKETWKLAWKVAPDDETRHLIEEKL